MARKIILVDVRKHPSGPFEVSAVFWLTAPANRIIPKPGATSRVPDATALELSALQNGTVVERAGTETAPAGTGAVATRALLVTAYNAAQSTLDATAVGANFIGATWDGSVWT